MHRCVFEFLDFDHFYDCISYSLILLLYFTYVSIRGQLEASFEKVELGETEHNVRRDLLRVSVVDARPMKVDPAGGGLMRRPSRDAFAAYSRATAAEAALKTLVCCRFLNILLFGILSYPAYYNLILILIVFSIYVAD